MDLCHPLVPRRVLLVFAAVTVIEARLSGGSSSFTGARWAPSLRKRRGSTGVTAAVLYQSLRSRSSMVYEVFVRGSTGEDVPLRKPG